MPADVDFARRALTGRTCVSSQFCAMTRSAPEPAEQRLTTGHSGRRRRKRSNLIRRGEKHGRQLAEAYVVENLARCDALGSSEKFLEHLKWLRGAPEVWSPCAALLQKSRSSAVRPASPVGSSSGLVSSWAILR